MKQFDKKNYVEDVRRKIPGYDLMAEIIFRAVIPNYKDTHIVKNILCIGGQNYEVQGITEAFPTAKLFLIEPSQVMIDVVREECLGLKEENIRYVCDKFENFNVEQSFDLCLCLLVIQFVEDIPFFLKKIHNSLGENAMLILSVFSKEQLEYWKYFALHMGADFIQVQKTYERQEEVMKSLSRNEVENHLKNAGFHNVEMVCQILPSIMWVAEK